MEPRCNGRENMRAALRQNSVVVSGLPGAKAWHPLGPPYSVFRGGEASPQTKKVEVIRLAVASGIPAPDRRHRVHTQVHIGPVEPNAGARSYHGDRHHRNRGD